MNDPAVEFWRRVTSGSPFQTWVVFEHGTCVVIREPGSDVAHQARSLLANWPVQPGGSGGDFTVARLRGFSEWAVLCGHPDILNYVTVEELDKVNSLGLADREAEIQIGFLGRMKRNNDAKELNVIHVETV